MVYVVIFVPIILLIVSIIVGWKMANKRIKKHIREKPYLNKKQIRAIFRAMGVQVSEQQVNQMENTFKKAGEDKE